MRKRTMLATLTFVLIAGVIGACSQAKETSTGPAVRGEGIVRAAAPEPAVIGAPAQPAPAANANGASVGATGLDIGLPVIGPKIIKTAELSVEVKKGTFDQQFQEATLIAGRHGGFVASSETAQDRRRSGTLVIRVPASEFEAAVGELKGLGTLTRQSVSGSDVTSQFVDLQARLRNWETQESVLLKLLAKSTTIDDSIKVQRALQDVQLAIEEIRGELRVLSDQTDFSTISLAMVEAGPVPVSPHHRSSLARAWHHALDGFVAVIAAVVVGAGYLAPFALMALAAVAGWWGYRRYRRVRQSRPVQAA